MKIESDIIGGDIHGVIEIQVCRYLTPSNINTSQEI